MQMHTAEVVSVIDLFPGMRRIVLGGDGLAGFETTGVGDEYVRLFLPDEGGLRVPFVSGQGWDWPDGVAPAPLRNYTVRSYDEARGEVTLDIVLHAGGVAAEWARRAQPGDTVALNTPCGLYAAPADLAWQLLVTDLSGFPAAMRLLERTAPGVRSRLVVEVPGPEARWDHEVPEGVEVRWVHGGNGVSPSRIEQVVRRAERPEGVGYVWVVGETRVLRGVRRHLRHELGLPATAYKVVAYWIEHAEDWNARMAALDPAVRDELYALWDSERDEEEIEDEYTERLISLGL